MKLDGFTEEIHHRCEEYISLLNPRLHISWKEQYYSIYMNSAALNFDNIVLMHVHNNDDDDVIDIFLFPLRRNLNNLKMYNGENRSFIQISGFAKSLHLAFWQ